MRAFFAVAVFLSVSAFLAATESFQSKWHCPKATAEQQFEVGDVPGHSYGLAQATCTPTTSSHDEKAGTFTEFQDVSKDSFTTHGRMIVTLNSGDKTFYSYEASGDPVKNTASEKWKIVGGTGKQKTARGSGICTGTLNLDGTSDWVCTGTSAN
jgi:hypothetical protein